MKRREFLRTPAFAAGWGLAAAAFPAWALAADKTVEDARLLYLQGSTVTPGFGAALQGRPWIAAPTSTSSRPMPQARVAVHGHYLGKFSRIDGFSIQAVYGSAKGALTHDLYAAARGLAMNKAVGFHADSGTFAGLCVQRSMASSGLSTRPTSACLAPNSLTGSMQKGCYLLVLDPEAAGFVADELYYSGRLTQPLQDASGRRVQIDHVLLSVAGEA